MRHTAFHVQPRYPRERHHRRRTTESTESFDAILSQFEQTHSRRSAEGGRQISGTVVAVSAEFVFVDIGYKTEGVLPLALFEDAKETVEPGTKLQVSVKGRNEEGYYELSRLRVEQPKDWSALEQAFADKAIIVGTVTGVVKGGLTVDVGVRAFMPGSRSGARDAAEMERLVGQEIRCRIIKLDAAEEDVVVDRRAVAEEEDRSTRERRYSEIQEGDTVSGTVRSLTDYGAFVDIGGVDGLLHIGDIAWSRVEKPADILTVGQQIDAKVLKSRAVRQAHLARHEATTAAPMGCRRREVHCGRARARQGDAGHRLRRVRRTGAGHRRDGSSLRDVVGEEGEQARRHGQGRRCRRGDDSRRQCCGAPHVARIEADSGRSMGRCAGEVLVQAPRSRARSPASRSSVRSCSSPRESRG